jgi:hypothetical protein
MVVGFFVAEKMDNYQEIRRLEAIARLEAKKLGITPPEPVARKLNPSPMVNNNLAKSFARKGGRPRINFRLCDRCNQPVPRKDAIFCSRVCRDVLD